MIITLETDKQEWDRKYAIEKASYEQLEQEHHTILYELEMSRDKSEHMEQQLKLFESTPEMEKNVDTEISATIVTDLQKTIYELQNRLTQVQTQLEHKDIEIHTLVTREKEIEQVLGTLRDTVQVLESDSKQEREQLTNKYMTIISALQAE